MGLLREGRAGVRKWCGSREGGGGAHLGGHSFTAPSLEFMMRFWKRKNITATGIVMMIAAASLIGYCRPG